MKNKNTWCGIMDQVRYFISVQSIQLWQEFLEARDEGVQSKYQIKRIILLLTELLYCF